MHGGKSSGAKTPEGRERARMSNWRHGERSKNYVDRVAPVTEAVDLLIGLGKLLFSK
jgi:hypothetical protein